MFFIMLAITITQSISNLKIFLKLKKVIFFLLIMGHLKILCLGQITENKSGLLIYNTTLYMGDSIVSGLLLEQSLLFENNEVGYFHNKHLKNLDRDVQIAPINGGKPYVSQYHNLNTRMLIYRGRTPKTRYLVKDSMTLIPWKLSKNTKKIQNVECFSAQAEYRGRVWTAWYAPSIPVPSGPWKLYGLPGMILEAEDLGGFIKFECVSITIPRPQLDIVIEIPKVTNNDKSITTKEYQIQCEKDILNAEKMSIEIKADSKSESFYAVSDIDIFEFEAKRKYNMAN